MSKREWILKDGKLCLSGHPIRIRKDAGDNPFVLEHEGRRELPSSTLGYLKYEAERRADELEEFEPASSPHSADGGKNE